MKNHLVLFDFDGTLTYQDSFLEFIKFYHGTGKFLTGFILYAPILVLFKLKIIPNWKAKEYILRHFFKGQKVDIFNKKAREFSKSIIPTLLKPEAVKKLKWHQEKGHDIYLVSASCENWLIEWCKEQNMSLLGTCLETIDGRLTGLIDGKNCYGLEKVNRINEVIDLTNYNTIYAYGDSRGDKEMLNLAHKSYFRKYE